MTPSIRHRDGPDDHLTLALRRTIRRLLKDMWAHEAAARSFEDPEGVHQMRVASRRVRSALDTAGDLFKGKRHRAVRKGMRRLTRALGGVRDGDVLLMGLQRLRGDAGTGTHPGIDRLMARSERDRDEKRERLLSTLDELGADGFREASLDAFAKSRKGKGIAKVRRRDARRMVRRHIQEFLDHAASLPPEEDSEALHELRIATKRLRYALQLLRKPLMPESDPLIAALTEMQDQLGQIHDLDVLTGLVRSELHAIAGEQINAGLSGEPSPNAATRAAWDDLIALGRQVAAERGECYARLAAWWGDPGTASFRDDLREIIG